MRIRINTYMGMRINTYIDLYISDFVRYIKTYFRIPTLSSTGRRAHDLTGSGSKWRTYDLTASGSERFNANKKARKLFGWVYTLDSYLF